MASLDPTLGHSTHQPTDTWPCSHRTLSFFYVSTYVHICEFILGWLATHAKPAWITVSC